MRDLSPREVDELTVASQGDKKLSGLLQQALDEFDRTGTIRPVKERLIRKRLAKVKRRAAR